MAIPGLIAGLALLLGAPAGVECAPARPRYALERPRDTARRPLPPADSLELPSRSLLSLGRRSEPLSAVLVSATRIIRPFRSSLTLPVASAMEALEAVPRPSRGPPAL